MTVPDISALLHDHPLPPLGGDKEARGTALLVVGAPTCPGAAVLSANAALRAGAGRVQIVTHPAIATAIGLAVPEAFVTPWDLSSPVPDTLVELARQASAVLVGPGLDDDGATAAVALASALSCGTPLVLDACALPAVPDLLDRHLHVLPNLTEAHRLAEQLDLGCDLEPLELGRRLAEHLGSSVAVRGEGTIVVGGGAWRSDGHPGLGTAGSGDVLVGIAVGLLARGLPGLDAIGWAVGAHATAGELVGRGRANPGYLAHELLDAIPAAIDHLSDVTDTGLIPG
jgi:ADP-dependent NAD(P)H-hydrate dehydratase